MSHNQQHVSSIKPTNNNATNTTPHETIAEQDIRLLTDPVCLPQPYPAVITNATFKQTPSDFKVDEIMQVALSSEGEHLWLRIQKTGMNTTYVAEQLAKWANIPKRDVGYSGLKDRHAVTTQWFSLRIPKKQLPESDLQLIFANKLQADNPEVKKSESLIILEQNWHNKKLNRGTHKANHFVITLRDIELNESIATTQQDVDKVLRLIQTHGVPNYFGSQRFGRQGNNITQALEWFAHGTINGRKPHPKKSRDSQSMLLSAARSAIFNQIVARRVTQDTWNQGINGEVYNLNGSGSVFASEQVDDALSERVASGDIHPTAPLWGVNNSVKNSKATSEAKALEKSVIKDTPLLLRLAQGLEAKNIKVMRRATRLSIADFNWQWLDDATLVLEFSLPTGTFATSVIGSFVAQLNDA